jgi:hypothetical protein
MTLLDAAPVCPQCGEPIPDPAPKLCRKCSYPLVFVDRSPRLEAEARGLETPTPVAEPKPEPPPPPVVTPVASVPTRPCPACGFGNALDRTWCERCGQPVAPPTPPPPPPDPPPPPPPGWLRWVPGLVGALVLVTAGVAAWLIWFAPDSPPVPPSPTAPTAAPGPGVIPVSEITARASSTLPGTRQQSWVIQRTIDGSPSTAWQSNGFTDGGAPVTLRWEFTRPVDLSSIEVYNGYQADEARFWETARLGRILLITDAGEQEIELADELDAQTIDVGGRTGYVEFQITSAHRQEAKFPDLALSEVVFTGTME